MGTFGIIIICIIVISFVCIGWSLYTAPLMPDNYDLREEDIWPADEWPDLLEEEKHANKEN